MNFYQQKKLKDFAKEKWHWFLGSGIFLIITTVITIVGFTISGWNFMVWIHSKWAVTTFICATGLIYFLAMLLIAWIRFKVLVK